MHLPNLGTTLFKVLIPMLAIAAVIVVHRVRRLSMADNLGLTKPPTIAAAGWLIFYIVFILTSNYFMDWRGPWDFTSWRKAPLIIDILRVLAVGILGPIAEELIFRGVIYYRLARTNFGVPGAIGLTAIVWGGIHYTYTPGVILLLITAGVLLGLARWQTRSIITPMVMHIAWNLYAVW